MSRLHVRGIAAVSLSLFLLALPTAGPRADAAPGDLWQVVSQMSMEGFPMAMPAQTMNVCAAKEWTRPPGGDDPTHGCTTSDMVIDTEQHLVTWTSVCQDGMTGEGRIHRDGDDAYDGEIRYASDNGNVVIKLTGQRIGDCDNPQ